jgi:RNA polymerase-binding protein DksA
MSTIETGEFKERLLEERANLQEAIDNLRHEHADGGSLAEETGEQSGSDNHLGDTATETFDRELDDGLQEGAERQLEQIEAALQRIEDGSYGTCVDCGATISEARLTVRPEAARCVECQAKAEDAA